MLYLKTEQSEKTMGFSPLECNIEFDLVVCRFLKHSLNFKVKLKKEFLKKVVKFFNFEVRYLHNRLADLDNFLFKLLTILKLKNRILKISTKLEIVINDKKTKKMATRQ